MKKIYVIELRQDRTLIKIMATESHEKSNAVVQSYIEEMVKHPEVPQSVEKHECELD